MSNDVGGFASYYGPHRRSPYRALTLGSDPARFQTEPPACYLTCDTFGGPERWRLADLGFRGWS